MNSIGSSSVSNRRQPRLRVGRWLLLLGVIGLCCGAATGNTFVSGQWCRYTEGGWRIISDLPAAKVAQLLAHLRQTRWVYAHLTGVQRDQDPALDVWVFNDRAEYRQALGRTHFAGFAQPSLNVSRLLIGPVAGAGERGLFTNARHELTHHLQRSLIDWPLPAWQEEGQASVLGALRYPASGGLARLLSPDPPPDRQLLSVRQVLATRNFQEWRRDRLQAFYATARRLVHAGLAQRSRQADLRGAWGQGAAMQAPRARGNLRALRLHDVPSFPVLPLRAEDCLDASQLQLELARALILLNPQAAERLYLELPEDARATALSMVLRSRLDEPHDPEQALRIAEAALLRYPQAPSVIIQVANLITQDCWFARGAECPANWRRAQRLYQQVLTQDPSRVDAIYGLGVARLYAGLAGDGLNYLRIAQQRAPWSPQVNFYLGEALRLIGHPAAANHLRMAQRWARNEVWRVAAQHSLAELDREQSQQPQPP